MNDKIEYLQRTLNDLTEGAENDSKNSAGDKHETGRAMMQLEHEKVSRQMSDALLQKATMEQINPDLHNAVAGEGSLLKTNKGYLYMSSALGKMNVADTEVITLSLQSPLGKKLAGLKANESVEINGIQYVIEELY